MPSAIALMLILAAPPASPPSTIDSLAQFGFSIAEPMNAKEAGEVRARVSAELARPEISAAFEDASDTYGGALRHKASGLSCPFGKEGQSIEIEGDGAICRFAGDGMASETRVMRAPQGTKLDKLAKAAGEAARQEPGFRVMDGPQVEAHPKPGSGTPDHRTLRWISQVDGRPAATRLQIGIIRGWVLTERHVGPVPTGGNLGFGEVLAETLFGHSMNPKKR